MAVHEVGNDDLYPRGFAGADAPEADPRSLLEIAHVLFLDLVGYSKLPMEEQTAFTQELQGIVRATREFQVAQKEGKLISMPTGDGMVLVFFGHPMAAAGCSVQISQLLSARPHLKLRMGIHTGPVYRVADINANQNVSGAGINFAQRVMDCGDAGHLLLSREAAEMLRHFGQWTDHLHDIGEYEVKHGVVVHIFNLYSPEFGNPATPDRGKRRTGSRRRTALKWMGAGLGATLSATLVWYEFPRAPKQKLVAILPFRNIGGDPGNQAFCDGLVETLTSKLTEMQQFQDSLWVVPASELRRESLASARQAKEMFGANLVLTGSLQREGEHLRLAMNLVDTSSLRQLQAITMDSQMQDPAALQDGVISACARMLDIAVHPAAQSLINAGGTAQPRAYDLYLQGQGNLLLTDKAETIDSAIALFSRALELDPNYAAAYAGLGRAYWRKYQGTREAKWVEEARNNCNRAIQINDKTALAHVYLGTIYAGTGKSGPALDEFRKALTLDPVSADAYRGLAGTYDTTGRPEEAEAVYKHAIELRPGQWIGYSYLGVFYYRHARYSEAETAFRRIMVLAPGNYIAARNLGGVYLAMGRYKEAAQVLEKALSIRANASNYNNLANVYYFQGRYQEAAALTLKAIELNAKDYRNRMTLGDIYSEMPNSADKARSAYEKAIELAEGELSVNPSNILVLSELAVCYARISNKPAAVEKIEKARQLAPDSKDVIQDSIIVYEVTGNRDFALRALKDAVARKYPLEEIRRQPGLAALRNDPLYQQLVPERK